VSIWVGSFWKATAERAAKTLAQSLIAVLAVGQTTLLTVDWQQALAVAATATVLSILSSVASAGVGNAGPSLASETVVPPLAHSHDEELVDMETVAIENSGQ
jgi:hypothetical protein